MNSIGRFSPSTADVAGLSATDAFVNQLLQQSKCRADVVHGIVSHLDQYGVKAAFLFSSDSLDPDRPRDLQRLLPQQPSSVPSEIQRWAQRLGSRAIAQKNFCSESTEAEDTRFTLVAQPLASHGSQEALVALFNQEPDESNSQWLMSRLAGTLDQWDQRQEVIRVRQQAEITASILEIVAGLEKSADTETACKRMAEFVFQACVDAGSSTNDLGMDVYVATLAQDQRCELKAISGRDKIDGASHAESVLAAMGEAQFHQRLTQFPANENSRQGLLCHARLATEAGYCQIVTVPLEDAAGKITGVLQVASQHPIATKAQALLRAVSLPFGAAIELVARAEGNRLQRAWLQLQHAWKEHRVRTGMKVGTLLLAVSMIPTPYQVPSTCELQPAARRFVSAPFEVRLKSSVVEPGDLVREGDLLATLDEKEIRMELAEVEAEYWRAEKSQDGHLASHKSGEARLAQYEAAGLNARRDLLRSRCESLKLTSPIDGMVIAGDLKDARGMPLETGQNLYEIAPLEQLKVDVLVAADDIRYVDVGMTIRMRFDAFPFESFTATVRRVNPASEIRDSANVFLVRAVLDNRDGRLRPGMKGQAKITSSWQPLAWQYLRKPIAATSRWLGW